jgi:hypothetical protein
MAQVLSEKQINAFVKGIITEASPLTFPENASLDEDNFDLELNGSRVRRLGIDYEEGYALNSTGITSNIVKNSIQSSHIWELPGGDPYITLGVIRVIDRLYFINLLAPSPSVALMNLGLPITINGMGSEHIQTAVLNNYLVITGGNLTKPVILSYNATLDTIAYESIPITIRDTFGVEDYLADDYRQPPSGISTSTTTITNPFFYGGALTTTTSTPVGLTLTDNHRYNLKNQGWSDKITVSGGGNCIDKTMTTALFYPANTDQVTLGYDPTNASFKVYDPNRLKKWSIDNTYVSRGSYLIDAFNRGGSRVEEANKLTTPSNVPTDISNLPQDKDTGHFTTIASYAGRAFYSGVESTLLNGDRRSPNYSNFIFFSQIVTGISSLGKCYQNNDPTSGDISDLLDDDGGTIQILEAGKIIKLITRGDSLLVFADNGVWEIYGDTGGFVATSYQIGKISSVGVVNPHTILETTDNVVFWGKTGIYRTAPDATTGRTGIQNISISTIQTLYNDIPEIAKREARGIFDEASNHVRWMYNDKPTYNSTNYLSSYNKELLLDLSLEAFYKYSISDIPDDSVHVVDYIKTPTYSIETFESPVITKDSSGTFQEVTAGGSSVVIDTKEIIPSTTKLYGYRFLTFRTDDVNDVKFTLSTYKNKTFKDWGSINGGVDFESFLVTGYDGLGDLIHTKAVPTILFYLERTEDGFEDVGGDLILKNQSSCRVQSQWNWTNSANSGKWGQSFEAYRLLRNYVPSGPLDDFDYGEGVIVTKNKLRGSGRTLSLKITSTPGKDMKLLGWGMSIATKSKL